MSSTVAVDPSTWLHLLRKLELEPHPLVAKTTNELLSVVLEGMAVHPDQSRGALRTLMGVAEECVVESVIGEVCRVMGAPEVISVTTDEMEIMLTPPIQLWNPQLRHE